MIRKLIAFSVMLFFYVAILVACDGNFGNGGVQPEVTEYEIKSLAIMAGHVQIGWHEHLEFTEVSFPDGEDTLSTSEFAIAIEIEKLEEITTAMEKFNFFPVAMAGPTPYSKSKISLISITSPEPFFANGEVLEAGENLTSYFSANDWRNEPTTVLKYVRDLEHWLLNFQIYLQLDTQLTQPVAQVFDVTVTMDNGAVFELQTPGVVVKN